MSHDSGTPLTAEQRRALADLRDAAKTVDRAIARRDQLQREAESVGLPAALVMQSAGIV